MTIDLDEAKRIFRRYLDCTEEGAGFGLSMLDQFSIERPFGWVFLYDAAENVTSGKRKILVVGNAPVIVDRRDGSIHVTGTAMPVEHYIAEYEEKREAE